jgi:hypothetical protein
LAPGQFDAAYNYEYLVRARRLLLPSGQTAANGPHGEEGTEPRPKGMNSVKSHVPLQSDEDPKKGGVTAGKNAPKTRKG